MRGRHTEEEREEQEESRREEGRRSVCFLGGVVEYVYFGMCICVEEVVEEVVATRSHEPAVWLVSCRSETILC